MINAVACACAEPWNPPFNLSRNYEKSFNLLTDVIKQLFITFDCLLVENSTFIKARNLQSSRLETNKVLYNDFHIYDIFICVYLLLVYLLSVCWL